MMVVKIMPHDKDSPTGKLADAEVHFTDGVLEGMKLLGYAIRERKTGEGRTVKVSARAHGVNGERRRFWDLRPHADVAAQYGVRDLVLQPYAHFEHAATDS